MPKAKKPQPEIQIGTEGREIERELRTIGRRMDLCAVWSDWIEMQALAYSNACDLYQREDREARYMEIVKRYEREEIDALARCAGLVALALSRNPWQDLLGHLFMMMELSNKYAGQFFTPYSLCTAMARMTAADMQGEPPEGFWTACDPCIGGGATLIALCEALAEKREDWPRVLHLTGQDIDLRSVHMAYIQLSLIGAPAMVIHGNTLALETRSVWYTPAHVYSGWSMKLRRRHEVQEQMEPVETPELEAEALAMPGGQKTLSFVA